MGTTQEASSYVTRELKRTRPLTWKVTSDDITLQFTVVSSED